MTEALKGKESLSEKESVREDTRSGLKALKKDVEKADQERKKTEKNVLACIIYLELTDLKKSYEEIMEKDSQTTIKSVQYLLKNLGYDVGEVDGILVTNGKKTSKTMEAIKKFQRDNGLKLVDGLPGGKTIKKLLEKHYSIINSRSVLGLKANGLTTLTNKEAEYLGKNNLCIDLDRITKITDKQAELLSDLMILQLDGLTSITDNQAESLSKVKTLWLNGLTSITDNQAESLSKISRDLYLNGLKSITDNQAESLGKVSGSLELAGLTSITDKQAKLLGKVKRRLNLNGLKSITNNQAESLSKVDILQLKGLTKITDNQAESLGKVNKELDLSGLKSITDNQAKLLKNVEKLVISSISPLRKTLTPTQRKILGNLTKR